MDTPLLDGLRNAVSTKSAVYMLVNTHKMEIYFGVSLDPNKRVEEEHSKGETKALMDWDWESESISPPIIIVDGISQLLASMYAHNLEKIHEGGLMGCKVIQTAGI